MNNNETDDDARKVKAKRLRPKSKGGLLLTFEKLRLRADFGDNWKRREMMGDKGGKKDKEKSQKQNSEKKQETAKKKLDKQQKRKP